MENKCEEVEDDYGNIIGSDCLTYCVFPNCGCDGARLCMAKNGASERAYGQNVEGMWNRSDKESMKAKLELMKSVIGKDKGHS